MKKILLLMLVSAAAFVSHAEITGYQSIVFYRTDGTALAIAMEDDMTVNIANGDVTLDCDKGIITMPIAELKYWNYSKIEGDDSKWQGIEDIIGETVKVVVTDDCVTFQNLPENSSVSLVSMDGRVIVADKASGEYEISLSELNYGVYVLTYNGKSIKIAVK